MDPSAFTVERFVRECAQGRLETVKKMLPKMRERVSLPVLQNSKTSFFLILLIDLVIFKLRSITRVAGRPHYKLQLIRDTRI